MKENIVKDKSYEFAIEIVEACKRLTEQKEFVLSRQLLRSGTAVGALIRESEHAESKQDFIHKLSISLKEANETEYWLELLFKTDYLNESEFKNLRMKVGELNRLLISIIRTTKEKLKNN
ncbi:MAG: four helix bundle protein [Flavobacteriales bacterium]|nr:four helix bundle protein [Flavobacteriales bacterium]|tara:strand:- start:132 stop:491 length:360 start_codon:yes stop_codon:yes gene_type:complete